VPYIFSNLPTQFLRAPVQDVAETTVEPRLTRRVVVLWVDRLVVDVRKMSAQTRDLLNEPALRVGHQFPIALIPEFVTMRDRPRDTAAVRLDGMFRYEFRLEWRQLAMPVDHLGPLVVERGVHRHTSSLRA